MDCVITYLAIIPYITAINGGDIRYERLFGGALLFNVLF